MYIMLSWISGLVRHRPSRLLGAMTGIALGAALLACLGAFIESSVKAMTKRSIEGLAIDWQILLLSEADAEAVHTVLRAADPKAIVESVEYAEIPGLVAATGETVQNTGDAVILGIEPTYREKFPTEIVPMLGSDAGVLLAQQTAANLHVSIGDRVTIRRAGGLLPIDVEVDGIINLPESDSLFQKIGSPASARQAPPDNVMILPADLWRRVFSAQRAAQPNFIHGEIHVRTSRSHLSATPDKAYAEELRTANHFEAGVAGRAVIADNLASKLASVRIDAFYARALFLFLGLPGIVVAVLLTIAIAGSGKLRRRQQQALLRTRGAPIATILKLAAAEAVFVGFGGAALGTGIFILVSAFLRDIFAISLSGKVSWLVTACCFSLFLALIAILQPAWSEARQSTVAAARTSSPNLGTPLWRSAYLDLALLAIAAVDLWWIAGTGYDLVLAPEGVASISVHYEAFIGPFCLWTGLGLSSLRLFEILLKRGLPIAVKLQIPPFSGKLSSTAAATLVRQRVNLSRAMALVALAVSFAVSTALFNATFQTQSRIDAELTNGSDVMVTDIHSAAIAGEILGKIKALPGVVAAGVLQHGYAYVGNDLQDIYGIDPKTIGNATHLVNAYFADGTMREILNRLTEQPEAVLVSDETVTDFQLHRGDELNLRLEHGKNDRLVPFRFVGIVREFPTAPKDSFLVANSDYLASKAPSELACTILVRVNGEPSVVAGEIHRVVESLAPVKITAIDSTQRQLTSSLAAVDLRGLTLIELSFAIVLVVGATALALFLSLSERKRSFAILAALGAKRKDLAAFMWSETWTILLGGGLVGLCIGALVAFALVRVLAGVFDPPPEVLTVPWIYLLILCATAVALTVAGVTFHLRELLNKSIVHELRSWV
jgi:putative ABC transport system permease protein